MNLWQAFGNKAPNKVFISILLGALAGMSYSLLIPVVLSAIAGMVDSESLKQISSQPHTIFSFEISNFKFSVLFFVLCMTILVAKTLSQVILIRVSMDLTTDLRIKLYNCIMSTPLTTIEEIGPSKLTVTVSEDVRRVVSGAQMLPELLTNFVTLVGMLGFLLFINKPAFIFTLEAIAFGVITYQVPIFYGQRIFVKSGHLFDNLQERIRGLIYGIKELRLDRRKRNFYFNKVLLENEYQLLKSDKRAYSILSAAVCYGDLISFFVIGVLAFIFVNYRAVNTQELTAIVMALLYITGPVAVIMHSVPLIATAMVSLNRIENLFGELRVQEGECRALQTEAVEWREMTLSGVCYQHKSDVHHDGFKVGPIDLVVKKGEILFIVGGNGSGKSTLAKVLSLHYAATDGSISFDRNRLTEHSVECFQQGMSVIFSDYYLFDRLLFDVDLGADERARAYMAELELDEKVSIKDGKFSTINLSDGQRKRLALVAAFMDDKALYLFDEWAADQDPVFKEKFYNRILPALKADGKAVVVVSHDDRYFDVADKIVYMEDGKIVKQKCRPDQEMADIETADNFA